MTPETLLAVFKKDLENLKDNDKFKINALTIFARDHKDVSGVAQGVVELTTKHVHSIPAALKLLGLYVIDSIVKNVGAPYRKLYTGCIVDAFVHSFQAIRDEKGRMKLYKLRTTWTDIFSNNRMYELDIRVREHDPAWPLLASPPDTKPTFRSLPNIPRIQIKPETAIEQSNDKVVKPVDTKTVISASRDPRLNRKRKSDQSADGEFLIDRSGDRKMEAVARKQGKQAEVDESTKKVPLFGEEDRDMRSQASIAASPARSVAWSTYMDKHSEVCSRRENKDVDMRFSCSSVEAQPATLSIVPTNDKVSEKPAETAAKSSLNSCSFPAVSDNVPPLPNVPVARLSPSFSPNEPVRVVSDPPIHAIQRYEKQSSYVRVPTNGPQLPVPSSHQFTDYPRERPVHPLPKRMPPYRGPPISGPIWSVEIDGFPDMVNIGVDPRMLSLVSNPKPPRRITIDGQQFTLLLNRVQPLIPIGDHVHAVRFRCEFATVVIGGRCFNIPGTGFTKIDLGDRLHCVYLGGPGHELVIDGRPHTVPLTSHLTFINIGRNSVGVRFVGNIPKNVNVLPPIPPSILKWAGQGLFGSPWLLELAPFNPLKELSRLAEANDMRRLTPRSDLPRSVSPSPNESDKVMDTDTTNCYPNPQSQDIPPAVSQASNDNTVAQPSLNLTTPNVDVHELFRRLVQAGIVSDSIQKPSAPPELENYSWDRFKIPYEIEIEALYAGHQCSQCGLRFESDHSPEFAKHLDYHYMKNSSDFQDRRSRNFYQNVQYWLISEMTCDGAPQFDEESPIQDTQEYKCPAFPDPSKNVCAVCYEKFEVVWDHEEEEWMLKDAVVVGDKVYHPICQEDAGKEFKFGDDSNVAPESEPVEMIEPKLETTSSLGLDNQPVKSEPEEHAFTCEDILSGTVIPGLSPPSKSPQLDEQTDLKSDPELFETPVSAQTDSIVTNSQLQKITADPLAALNAVLKGDLSSLT